MTSNVQRLARCERLVRLIMRARTRSMDALLDLTSPALVPNSRYTINAARADRFRAQYAQEWAALSECAR